MQLQDLLISVLICQELQEQGENYHNNWPSRIVKGKLRSLTRYDLSGRTIVLRKVALLWDLGAASAEWNSSEPGLIYLVAGWEKGHRLVLWGKRSAFWDYQ